MTEWHKRWGPSTRWGIVTSAEAVQAASTRCCLHVGTRLQSSSRWTEQVLIARISEEQLHRVRVAYLGAVLRQEVGWIDARQPDALSAQVRSRSRLG